MMKNSDISCIFNSDARLLISQEATGNILIETDDTTYGADAFESPFIIFHPNNSPEYHPLFTLFHHLINKTDSTPLQTLQERPHVKACQSCSLTQSIGHGGYSKLSFHTTSNELIGIRAGAHAQTTANPIIWINPPQDTMTNNAKAAILSLSKN